MNSRRIFSGSRTGSWLVLAVTAIALWLSGMSQALAQNTADDAQPAAQSAPAEQTAVQDGKQSGRRAVNKSSKHQVKPGTHRKHRKGHKGKGNRKVQKGKPMRGRLVRQPDGTAKLVLEKPEGAEADAAVSPERLVKDAVKNTSSMEKLWQSTGLYGFLSTKLYVECPNSSCHSKVACASEKHHPRLCSRCHHPIPASAPVQRDYGWAHLVMIIISMVLIYLAIVKEFEPLLLLPIGFGGLLSNIPLAGIADPGGFLYAVRDFGINPDSCLFPLLIFMGVGAMTDFGPLIANPRTALLGGAAQFGIFTSLIGAVLLNDYCPGIEFSLKDAASIGIIGGADGPTSIFLSSKLSPNLVGSIAVAAYSYMALVPIIQPPIMRWLTTKEERGIVMKQLRPVSKLEKVMFPLVVLLLCAVFLPSAAPLIGALMFGNLAKECNVVSRLSDTMQNALMNIVTILLGLCVGSKLAAEVFLTPKTLGILVLGLLAFAVGTASGVILAKIMNKLSPNNPVNPLIGAAGVSAVPMAARVANKVGMEENPGNVLLMNAMGPNVAGVIGSAVAAGVLLAFLG